MAQVNHNRFKKHADHPDISYLKSDAVGKVLAKGLGQLYKNKPSNPLHFLGNWLVNYAAFLRNKDHERLKAEEIAHLRQKHDQAIHELLKLEEKSTEEILKKFQKEADFKTKIKNTLDVDDLLNEFTNHLRDALDCTGVYIGLLEKVKRPVSDLDGEGSHIDESAPEVIRYISASAGSEFLIGKVLRDEEGEVTYSVWKEDEEIVDKQEDEEQDLKDHEKKPKFAYVPDVVNNPKIKFFDVPKLGAYFATPLIYNSCLSEFSFDAAVEDALECRKQRADQEIEKEKAAEEQQASLKEGEEREEVEERVWDEIKEAPYNTDEIKLVVCLDTLGQDCEISEAQRNYVIEWVQYFRAEWERAENESLKHDVTLYIKQHDLDLQNLQDKQGEWVENERLAIEEKLNDLDVNISDEARNLESGLVLLELFRQRLLEKYVIEELYGYRTFKVLKFGRVIQLALYFFGAKKEEIVEPATNKIK